MADESVLRLRIEADTTGLQTGLNRAEGEMGQFATETRKVEQQLKETAAAADKASTEFVKLADKSHSSFGQMTVAFTGATVAGNALLAALDGLTRGLAAPVLEILDAEESAALLAGTFQGLQSEIDKVTTLAKELSAIGPIFDDDNLSRAAAQLRLFGANADAIQELLPYVNNLAMAFGIDVADAAKLVGQALNGQVRALGNLVPEIRTATSQTEVLAAIQGTAARNAQIAEQRMAGLGGQLALVKRQLGDAAQAFGNLLLPAMQRILSFINANMMPAFGKLAGAFVAIQTYFSNLGKGLDLGEITRRVGEAIIRTEESFAKVEPRIVKSVGNIKGVLKDLTLQGTFATQAVAKAAAPAAAKPAQMQAVQQYAQPIGPAVPPGLPTYSAAENLASIREADRLLEARRRADEAYLRDKESTEERIRRAQERWAQEALDIQEEIARKNEDAARRVADTMDRMAVAAATAVSNLLQALSKGEKINFGAAALDFTSTIAGDLVSLIPGISERAASLVDKLARPVTDAIKAVAASPLFAGQGPKFEAALKAENEIAAKNMEAARIQFEAAQKQRDSAIASTVFSQERRRAEIAGPAAVAAYEILQAVGPMPGQGSNARLLANTIAGASEDQLRKFGDLAETALKGLGSADQAVANAGIKASEELFKLLTGGRITGGDLGNLFATQEVLLQLVERFGNMEEPGTIQQGTSPDRPVYVFDVRPRDAFAFAPESFFFRNRGADTSRAVAGSVSLPAAQSQPVAPRQVRPGDRPPSRIA